MKSVQKTAPGAGLELREVPVPRNPSGTDAIVDIMSVGICGSDIHIDDWSAGYEFMIPHLPVTIGHEMSGIVREIGPAVTTLRPGDRVVVAPGLNCGTCDACRRSDSNGCVNKAIPGFVDNGGMARALKAPETSVFPIPDALDLDVAALVEPMTVCARAAFTAQVQPGDKVVVLGPGTIGQGIAFMARLHGAAEVLVAGFRDESRLAVVNRLGLPDTYDLSEDSAFERMKARIGAADIVFEATGNPVSIAHGMSLLRREGKLVVTGIHAGPAEIDLIHMVRQRLQLRASHGADRADWPYAIDVLHRHGETLRAMITHRLPLEQALEGFRLARSREASKVLLQPGG